MIHLYTGEGKGKTTAALGLALRAAGRGRRVVIVQFLKGQETGELSSLARIPGITVLRNSRHYGFFSKVSGDVRGAIESENSENLRAARSMDWDLLVLDEACAAWTLGAVDRAALDALIAEVSSSGFAGDNGGGGRELVLTGRDAPAHFREAADYVSRIDKVKHPFDKGIAAREGIEY